MRDFKQIDVTTPSDYEVVIKRGFEAPRSLVFDAFTKPELVRRWLYGMEGWSLPVCEIDLRVGGAYRYQWRNDANGELMGMGGVFREVEIPTLYSATEKFDEAWYPGEAIVRNDFVDAESGTIVTLSIRYETKEARDAAMQTGMSDGVGMSYDRLDGVLESLQGASK